MGSFRSFANDALLFLTNRVIGRIPSHMIRLWWYRAVLRAKIGKGSSIFMNAWFDTKGLLVIGRDCVVNQACRLDSRAPLTIGDNVIISAEVCILTADHDLRNIDGAGRNRSVTIEDYVFVGTRAMILPGVTLHRGCGVAAGAVVSRDVPAFTIVAGIPARPIGERPSGLRYNASYRRFFA